MTSTILQSLVLPHFDLPSHETLCLRLRDAWCELASGGVVFQPGGTATSDTFYGSLTVGLWKNACDLRQLTAVFEGRGEFVLSFGLHRLSHATVWLGETHLDLDEDAPVAVDVPGFEGLQDGMLFWRLRALRPSRLFAARYETRQPAARDVRLGLVITHFNRQAQALPAIERLRRHVLERPDLHGRVSLTVVDNSRNLPLASGPSVTVVPNRNLGGTGGFVRGLLELVDGRAHTHALFMDDDASCEPEAVARTVALLGYLRDPRAAVAGALMSENEPWFTLEKGARFEGQCRPLFAGGDMREVEALLWSERCIERPNYGGWWFFAFALDAVRRWPFPFFVRGDDVLFSLMNEFPVVTANGIASYGEDFRAKHGPMTAYLDARYHFVHALLQEPKRARRAVLRGVRRLSLRPLLAYHYTSARAVALALRHVLEGPSFFERHLDIASIRTEIAGWTPDERPRPLDRAAYDARKPRRGREPRLRALARALTLQGFLLPSALIRDRMVLQEKGFHGRPSAVFRYRRVLYEHFPTNTGYVAEYDRPRFFQELGRGLAATAALLRRLPALCRSYREGVDAMTTPAFWRGVYGERGATSAATTPAPADGAAARASPRVDSMAA